MTDTNRTTDNPRFSYVFIDGVIYDVAILDVYPGLRQVAEYPNGVRVAVRDALETVLERDSEAWQALADV